jgi:copper(I)-binding protein
MIMSRLTPIVFAVAIASIGAVSPSFAHEFKAGSITVEHPWSRATPGGAQVGAGYLTIQNEGDAPDRLVSATAEIAGRTQIHQMSMVDGVMKMRELTDGLPVPAKGSVTLEPNAYHLMFLDLKRPLKEGEEFSGTLTFEKAGTVDVTFEVEGTGAKAPEPNDHHHD